MYREQHDLWVHVLAVSFSPPLFSHCKIVTFPDICSTILVTHENNLKVTKVPWTFTRRIFERIQNKESWIEFEMYYFLRFCRITYFAVQTLSKQVHTRKQKDRKRLNKHPHVVLCWKLIACMDWCCSKIFVHQKNCRLGLEKEGHRVWKF